MLGGATPGKAGLFEDSLTSWAKLGKAEIHKGTSRDGNIKCQAGRHFVVAAPAGEECVTFPAEPDTVYKNLRHPWVLRRRKRP